MSTHAQAVNNLATTLASAHAAADGQLVLAAGTGVRLGALGADRVWRLTALVNPETAAETVLAIFEATGRSDDTLSGVTAVEGYADVDLVAGTALRLRATAKQANDWSDAINAAEAAIALRALDSAVPHLTGAETIAGVKTFSSLPILANLTGLVKASAGALSAAVAGTDYLTPTGNGSQLTGITESQVTNLVADLAAKAPLASPTFTGTPAAPTAAGGTNTTQLATTAFVASAVSPLATDSAVVHKTGTETITGFKSHGAAHGAAASQLESHAPDISTAPFLAYDHNGALVLRVLIDGTIPVQPIYGQDSSDLLIRANHNGSVGGALRLQCWIGSSWSDALTAANTSGNTPPNVTICSAGGTATFGGKIAAKTSSVAIGAGHDYGTPGATGNSTLTLYDAANGASIINTEYPTSYFEYQRSGASRFKVDATGITSTVPTTTGSVKTFAAASSTTAGQPQARITPAWATSTDASRKGRLSLYACDFTGTDREGVRVESDGTQALVGLYGVAAVARQVLATGAGATVDNVITVLQTIGLCKQS